MNRYLAKTDPIQTIVEHTRELIRHMMTIKEKNPTLLSRKGWELLELSIYFHDLGKINSQFQNKLYGVLKYPKITNHELDGIEEMPHNYLSMALVDMERLRERFETDELEILYNAVARHHYRKRMSEIDNVVLERIDEILVRDLEKQSKEFGFPEIQNYLKNQKAARSYDKLIHEKRFTKKVVNEDEKFKMYVMIKGLLNRIDYVASSSDMDQIEIDLEDEKGNTLTEIIEDRWPSLREIQTFTKSHRSSNLIVVASTGIGKTEAALIWFGKKKGFFTLPLKTSINAIYDRIVSDAGYGYQNVSLLHGDARQHLMSMGDSYEEAESRYQATRLFAYPITVCTVDQLFTFVFKYPNSEILLSVLADAKVVIDEVQMYDHRVVASILYGLKWIVAMGGKFAIFTATLPKVLIHLMKETDVVANDSLIYHQALDPTPRHWVKYLKNQDFPIDEIIERGYSEKVLVIVNRVKKAQELFELIKGCEVHLLHSHFIRKDRQLLEEEILRFSNDRSRCGVWISTQIVEASLDIDFDVLYTSMTSLDGLIQRMGRVYRKRSYHKDIPNIYVCDNADGKGSIIDRDIYDFTDEVMTRFNDGLLTEEVKQQLMDQVFDPDKNRSLLDSDYYISIKENLEKLKMLKYGYFEKEEAKRFFRDIDSRTFIPRNVHEELERRGAPRLWEEAFHSKDRVWIRRTIQEIDTYTVNLSYYHKLPYHRLDERYFGKDRYVIDVEYDFDYESRSGKGIVKISEEEYKRTDHSNIT